MEQVSVIAIACALLVASSATLSGCRTVQHTSELDCIVAISEDAIAACRLDDALYFLVITPDGSEQLLRTRMRSDGTWTPVQRNIFPALDSLQGGKPALARLEDGTLLAVFPAHRTPTNVDLVECRFADGKWSAPRWMDELNSPAWDSQPALSPDGTLLLFVSDRPGGRGGKDIYLASQLSHGWSQPTFVGISTLGDDITPVLMPDSTMLFARRRDTTHGDYELFMARPAEPLVWAEAQPLPPPIASPADELAPVVWDSLLVFSTNRTGGHFSIAQTRLCGPVTLHVVVHPSPSITQLEGTLTVASSASIQTVSIGAEGTCAVHLDAERQYLIRYTNRCSNRAVQWNISAPCDPMRAVVIDLSVAFTDEQRGWETTLANVFLPDDYLPATEEHRTAAALLARYNLAAPEEQSASFDRSAIEELLSAVAARAACAPGEPITIELATSPPAMPIRYSGATLDLPALGGSLKAGELLSPERAALLRAYAAQQLLQETLTSHPMASQYQAQIHWRLAALDESGQSLRIRITIGDGEPAGW
ncbi:MAG: hypothetical protein KatS3mg038_0151 [Candidatus Kapaibacterium sp.]|nr:MAG: hypothetical protein KatS3mg038_0151 [Candidatus Kapabacteria bacterium]